MPLGYSPIKRGIVACRTRPLIVQEVSLPTAPRGCAPPDQTPRSGRPPGRRGRRAWRNFSNSVRSWVSAAEATAAWYCSSNASWSSGRITERRKAGCLSAKPANLSVAVAAMQGRLAWDYPPQQSQANVSLKTARPLVLVVPRVASPSVPCFQPELRGQVGAPTQQAKVALEWTPPLLDTYQTSRTPLEPGRKGPGFTPCSPQVVESGVIAVAVRVLAVRVVTGGCPIVCWPGAVRQW